jgi:hypothetical protein
MKRPVRSQTLLTAQQHRARAAYLRTLPGPKAKRAAQLAEIVAKMIDRRHRSVAERRVEEKLALARQNAELWSKIAAHPGMSPAAALAAENSARSHRACVVLCEKALAFEKAQRAELVDVAAPSLVPGSR